jgi:hypothetical protein
MLGPGFGGGKELGKEGPGAGFWLSVSGVFDSSSLDSLPFPLSESASEVVVVGKG